MTTTAKLTTASCIKITTTCLQLNNN